MIFSLCARDCGIKAEKDREPHEFSERRIDYHDPNS
jgi:hypothetical protein